MRRRRWLVLALVLLPVAAVAAALLLEFDSPALGQAALRRIGAATGARVSAGSFRLRLLRGLALRDVDASSEFPGGRWELALEALVLDHRVWPLLRGRLEVERLRFHRPRLKLTQRGARDAARDPRRAAAAVAAAPATALALRVDEARIEDGTLEVVTPGEPTLTVSGLDVRVRELDRAGSGASFTAVSAVGDARARTLRFARSTASDLTGEFRLAGGVFTAERIRFQTAEGRFEAGLSARLDRLPLTYTLDLRGDPLDLNAMAGLREPSLGPARVTLRGEGSGAGAAGLRGQGVLTMESGRLPASPLMQRLQSAVGLEGLVGARYEASETAFRMRDGRVHFDAFALRAESLRLDLRGWMALDGPLALAGSVRAPRDRVRVAGVAADVLDTLTDAEGRIVVPVTVTGTQQDPVVRPDVGAMVAQAGRGAGATLAKKAGEGLKDLLRRRRR
jgi:hypothetical protein